ncbi:unnamed protein product [Soboliphyme baturini]|uniref:AMP-binding domain-containing protein n=1 Tax=Soboliphyme baturini TaxID=241478 RepID=A0A183J8U5_9BILA|nr:unnamed protein product [Soboliphyme baturini]
MPLRSQLPQPLIQDVPLHELLLQSLRSHDPQTVLFITSETGRKYTAADILTAANGVASALFTKGLRKGDVVAYCMYNCPQVAAALIGTWMCGGVISGINPDYTKTEFQKCFRMCDAKFVITQKALLKEIHESAIYQGSMIKMIFLMDEDEDNLTSLPEQVTQLGATAAKVQLVPIPPIKFWTKTDLSLMLFSSGTTGPPKAVMLSHYGPCAWTQIMRNMPILILPTCRDHIIAYLPYFHIFGIYTLLNCLDIGFCSVTMEKFKFETFLQLLQQYKV